MKYRTLGNTGEKLSLLGFGSMRLPFLNHDLSQINEPEAIAMIRAAIDGGVNYVDTAYIYHGEKSEGVVGKALKDGYRERTNVATKLPIWLLKTPADMEKTLDVQLSRLDIDHLDFYLIHDIREERWDKVKSFEMFNFLQEMKKKGKIRYGGFSYHGETPAFFGEILNEYPWDFCQIQLNYLDRNFQAGLEGLSKAEKKGTPVMIMEPLKGGKLTDALPLSVQKYWDELGGGKTPAEWALRWVAHQNGVTTILSGMSNMAQVEENLRVLSDAEEGGLQETELAALAKVADEYNSLITYPCTGCRYCLPCAKNIDIPQIMNFRNDWEMFAQNRKLKGEFRMFIENKPSLCISCGKCEKECPQHLSIAKAMKETADIYE